MNRYQIMGVVVCCTGVFLGEMKVLMAQGLPFGYAVMLVYLVAVSCMLGMQHRARQSYESTRRPVEPASDRIATGQALPAASMAMAQLEPPDRLQAVRF